MTAPLLPPKQSPQKTSVFSVLTPVAVILTVVLVALSFLKRFEKSGAADKTAHTHLDLSVGTILPDLEFQSIDQTQIKLSSLGSRVVLINFWASWCTPCLAEIPSINALRKKYHDQGFEVVGINVDENPTEVLPKFQKKLGMEFTSYVDPEGTLSDLFDVQGIPFTVVLDKNRKVLQVETGDRDWFNEEMRQQMESWLEVKP
jgi:thiol-disulfide isomerase/thioredoxin